MLQGMAWTFRSRIDASWRTSRPLFIVSTGRVGTTSLVNLLNLSPDIDAHHEPKPDLMHLMPQAFVAMDERRAHFRRLFIRARGGQLLAAARRGKVFAESTLLKHYAPAIAEVMPNARFLHVHRHPGAVIRSTMRRGWYADHPYDRYRPRPGRDDPAYDAWPRWSAFEKNCWLWAAENEKILRLRNQVDASRFRMVEFEELFDVRTGAGGRLFDFVGVPRPGDAQIRAALAARHNEQQTGVFPRYDDWSDEMCRTLDRLAGPTMSKLGYGRPSLAVGSLAA